jgi:phosphate:Na+ symporter
MINRMVGVVVVLPFLQPIADFLVKIDPDPSRMAANFHSAFNIALALAFVLVLDQLAALLIRVLPDRTQSLDPSSSLYLDEGAIGTPALALTAAARETLHMGYR